MQIEATVKPKLELITASEIEPKEVRWLWYPYFPLGKVSIVQGDPGDGKSTFLLTIAAKLTNGEILPFCEPEVPPEPMKVIYQTTEDDADDTVVPRFMKAGGNRDRLVFINVLPQPRKRLPKMLKKPHNIKLFKELMPLHTRGGIFLEVITVKTFTNVSLPDDFDKILSVMRSREVSVSIILQNLAQIKALFEKQWESIVGNCDEFLYLGGNEQSTHKYVSELLGKATIDTNTYGKSTGRSGNYSTNYQITGRELLDASEVRLLDNSKAILFIRGEKPVMDDKYDILKHPNVALTTDGKAKPYIHGGTENAVATITFADVGAVPASASAFKEAETMYELLSNEELEEYFKLQEEKRNEKAE